MKKIVLFAVMMLLGAVQNVNAQNEVNDCGTLNNGGSIIGKIGFLKSNEGTMIFNLDGKILAPIGKYEKCKQQYGNLTGVEINNWPIPLNPSNSDEGLYIVKSNGRCGIVKLW